MSLCTVNYSQLSQLILEHWGTGRCSRCQKSASVLQGRRKNNNNKKERYGGEERIFIAVHTLFIGRCFFTCQAGTGRCNLEGLHIAESWIWIVLWEVSRKTPGAFLIHVWMFSTKENMRSVYMIYIENIYSFPCWRWFLKGKPWMWVIPFLKNCTIKAEKSTLISLL